LPPARPASLCLCRSVHQCSTRLPFPHNHSIRHALTIPSNHKWKCTGGAAWLARGSLAQTTVAFITTLSLSLCSQSHSTTLCTPCYDRSAAAAPSVAGAVGPVFASGRSHCVALLARWTKKISRGSEVERHAPQPSGRPMDAAAI